MKTKIYKRTSLAIAMSLCLLGSALAAPNALQADLSRLLKVMPEARVNSESRQAMRSGYVSSFHALGSGQAALHLQKRRWVLIS